MAANLTKEQLRNELISHGVQPPSSNSRKDEFVKLYEQHVAPIVSLRGDFSSDEENDVNEKMEKTEKNEDQVPSAPTCSAAIISSSFSRLFDF